MAFPFPRRTHITVTTTLAKIVLHVYPIREGDLSRAPPHGGGVGVIPLATEAQPAVSASLGVRANGGPHDTTGWGLALGVTSPGPGNPLHLTPPYKDGAPSPSPQSPSRPPGTSFQLSAEKPLNRSTFPSFSFLLPLPLFPSSSRYHHHGRTRIKERSCLPSTVASER